MDTHRRLALAGSALLLTLLGTLGCGEARSGPTVKAVESVQASEDSFDPSACATIRGQISWVGDRPKIPDFEILPNFVGGEIFHKVQTRPNPNAPVIDLETSGVAGVVIFLRGVTANRARPWNHGPVTVEQRDAQFHILQDESDSHCGFVRLGDRIRMVSRDRFFYALHAGGSEFFSLAFPDMNEPLERNLSHRGVVELASGAGYFWMRAYLFVDEHPYYTRTDLDGRFELSDVPPGRYELVCWMPSWLEARHDRDPESRLISRLTFRPPLEKTQTVTLAPREETAIVVSFAKRDLEP